jgi:hypothetical protein
MIELKISADAIALALACNAAIVYAARQRRAVHPPGKFDAAGILVQRRSTAVAVIR